MHSGKQRELKLYFSASEWPAEKDDVLKVNIVLIQKMNEQSNITDGTEESL